MVICFSDRSAAYLTSVAEDGHNGRHNNQLNKGGRAFVPKRLSMRKRCKTNGEAMKREWRYV